MLHPPPAWGQREWLGRWYAPILCEGSGPLRWNTTWVSTDGLVVEARQLVGAATVVWGEPKECQLRDGRSLTVSVGGLHSFSGPPRQVSLLSAIAMAWHGCPAPGCASAQLVDAAGALEAVNVRWVPREVETLTVCDPCGATRACKAAHLWEELDWNLMATARHLGVAPKTVWQRLYTHAALSPADCGPLFWEHALGESLQPVLMDLLAEHLDVFDLGLREFVDELCRRLPELRQSEWLWERARFGRLWSLHELAVLVACLSTDEE